MPAFIAHKLYPPQRVIPENRPPAVTENMVFLSDPADDMLFLDGQDMLYFGG
jgi:hypothetical protein